VPAKRRARRVLIAAWLPIALVALWFVLTARLRSPFFPPLSTVLQSFVHEWFGPGFGDHIVPSMRNLLIGFLIALVAGISSGVAIALLPLVDLLINPFLQFLRAMPSVALLPLALVLIGTADLSKMVLIAYGALWPILLNTVDGIKSIDPEVLQTARSYRVNRLSVLVRILLPGAFPTISVGVRLSLSIALVLMIGSEFYGATRGIGYYVLSAQQGFRLTDMWSGVILLGLIGYVLTQGYGRLESRLLRWREVGE
jgi:ABC-type nitrate/sulfonate/bicarbonate transport system permease component